MNKCPHCGYDEYYVKISMSGRDNYHYRYDGKSTSNSGLHDHLTYKENKTMYCGECNKKVGIKK